MLQNYTSRNKVISKLRLGKLQQSSTGYYIQTMETQQYQYRPLLGLDAIRIIIVHPEALISSSLSCSLIHSTLSHFHNSLIDQYTALSYVWGNANNTRTILVDEKPLSITANLETALRHMRDTQRDMMIWADGICINQSDTEEKSKQVRLMGKIYEVAMHTIIFLGETTPEYEGIFEILDSEIRALFPGQSLYKSNIETDDKLCGDFTRLVSNMEWFKRVWVLQELVLSRDPWTQVGSHRLRWEDFRNIIFRGKYLINRVDKKYPGYKYVTDMEEIRQKIKNTSSSGLRYGYSKADGLLLVLHLRRGHGVEDPRDMIYGHLALLKYQINDHSEIEKLLEIDYHKPLSEVYSNLALYLLNQQKSFGFLSYVEDVESAARRPCLPSWVPDWTSSYSSLDAEYHLDKREGFGFTIPTHLALIKSSVLGCTGTRVTVIENIKDIPPISDILALCQKIKDLHLQLCHSHGGSGNLDCKVETEIHEEFDVEAHVRQKLRKQALMILYEYLCSWLGICEQLDFEDGDTSTGLYSVELDFFDIRMEMICEATDFRHLFPLEPCLSSWWQDFRHHYSFDSLKIGIPHLLLNLLMALTDCSGNFFAGKRIAVLRNRKLALVSPQARVGDTICDFKDNTRSRYILRLLDKKTFSPDLDLSLIDFFKSMKDEARKEFVEYTHDGRLLWTDLNIASRERDLTVLNNYISKRLLQAGLRLPKVCDDHGDFIINPILEAKLDLVTSNMIKAMWGKFYPYMGNETEELKKKTILVQTDTSKVEHFQYVAECIIVDIKLQAGSSCTEPDQESNYSFTGWYEKDLPAEIPSDLDGDFDGEIFQECDNLDINNPTPSDPTTSSKTDCTTSFQTRTTLEMEMEEMIQPLRNIIIALH